MGDTKNIGAGNNEIVLSYLYWICTKMVQPDGEQEDCSYEFKHKFGEIVIRDGLDVLRRNLERPTKDEDDDE